MFKFNNKDTETMLFPWAEYFHHHFVRTWTCNLQTLLDKDIIKPTTQSNIHKLYSTVFVVDFEQDLAY